MSASALSHSTSASSTTTTSTSAASPHIFVNELLDLNPLARQIQQQIAPKYGLSLAQQSQLVRYLQDGIVCREASALSKQQQQQQNTPHQHQHQHCTNTSPKQIEGH